MWDYLCQKYRYSPLTKKPNYKFIPTNIIPLGDEGLIEFNKIYQFAKSKIRRKIVRTPSGGISIDHRVFFGMAYDLRIVSKTVIEMCIIHTRGMWRFQFRTPFSQDKSNRSQLSGMDAWHIILRKAKSMGIDIVKLAEDGPQYNLQEKIAPLICFVWGDDFSDEIFENAHHIDFHSSHPAGIANVYPQMRPLIEYFYEGRKENEENKCVMNYFWGDTLSPLTPKPLWHMGMNALKDTNGRVLNMASHLFLAGRKPIAFNTDGVWYVGEIYHGEGEGDKLGEWSNDHTNCKIRFRSPGAYEFIEDGVYHPVVRGRTRLDLIKPRNEWVWGDIYIRPEIVGEYTIDENIGIIEIRGDDERV